jgi:hypothetical protein
MNTLSADRGRKEYFASSFTESDAHRQEINAIQVAFEYASAAYAEACR